MARSQRTIAETLRGHEVVQSFEQEPLPEAFAAMLQPAVPFEWDRMALAVVGPLCKWTVGDVKGIDLEYYGAGALCDGMGV